MPISEVRQQVQERLASFLWEQWAQLGVEAAAARQDPWATDPEALLLMSLELGREEPRLLEEVLDWLVVNERTISVQRLRNLARDADDRALVEAAVGWLARWHRRPRLTAKAAPEDAGQPVPFYRRSELTVATPDPAFLAQGLIKPSTEPRRHSQRPDIDAPIAFAFRLRALLGLGVRAEALRVVLTVDAPWMNAQAIAASTAYTKRNVQEALGALRSAGVVSSTTVANEQRFAAPRRRWADFLELAHLPEHRDWPQLFAAYRRILRWLAAEEGAERSDYILVSRARTLAEEITPDLHFAGIAFDPGRFEGEDAWDAFADVLIRLTP